MKDEKYWARRRKNNLAAKRSRDARRMKENQIALRADFLERESDQLRKQLEDLKRENQKLKMKLIQYESSMKQWTHSSTSSSPSSSVLRHLSSSSSSSFTSSSLSLSFSFICISCIKHHFIYKETENKESSRDEYHFARLISSHHR